MRARGVAVAAAAALLLPTSALLLPAACSAGTGTRDAAPSPTVRVTLENAGGGVHEVKVELAASEPARQKGLMFREKLGANEGMLFVFETTASHGFWMKNTLIPLDMIFIGEDGRITGIVERAEPHSLAVRNGGPSRYVLEVNGGWAAEHGIRAGDRVRIEGLGPK